MFRLALALGKTVAELERTLTIHELAEWIAYWSIEPFGDEYRQTAQICNVIALVNGNKRSRTEDFMPSARQRQQTPEEMTAQLMNIPIFRKQMVEAEAKKNGNV